MANTKSSKKDLRRIAKRKVRNQAVKSALKTYVKKVRVSAATGDEATTKAALVSAISALDKASQRGIIHKNQAARRKSRVAKAAAKAGSAEAVAVTVSKPKAAPKKAAAKKA